MNKIERKIRRTNCKWIKLNPLITELDGQLLRRGDQIHHANHSRRTFQIRMPNDVHEDLLDKEIQLIHARLRQMRLPSPFSDKARDRAERFGLCWQRQ